MTHPEHNPPLTDTPPLLLVYGAPRLGKSSPLWWALTRLPADRADTAVTAITAEAERPESPR